MRQLTPSEKIKIIKEISTRLANEDWSLIDLTLRQFSLPSTDSWQGDKFPYVVEMIEDADDHNLINLAQHVGYHFENVGSPGIEPPYWRKSQFRLFVTHLAAHREIAHELKEALSSYGICCFVAHDDIEPTQEWQSEIETALSTCDALVTLLHPNFHSSNWTDQEIGFAMGRGIPVFSISFGQDPYGFIGRFQAFNGNAKTAVSLARELFDAYRTNKQTQKRMSEILISLFENSECYADAKERIGYLEELDMWEPSFATRIRSASNNNPQISEAWGVPEKVKALINKWEK